MSKYFRSTKWLVLFVLLTGCVSPIHKRIKDIKRGMDKSEVLDTLGSPTSSKFKGGMHEWTYIYYTNEMSYGKVLWFKKDTLIKISDYDFATQSAKSVPIPESVELNKKDIRAIKRGYLYKKKIKENEKQFKDID
jgi:hypothetical protein